MLVKFAFDCVRIVDRREGLVASGKQRIACTSRTKDNTVRPSVLAEGSWGSW